MPNNLTGQNISDTYQRLLQIEGGVLTDGTGSAVIVPSASYALSSSPEIIKEVSSSYAETASMASSNFIIQGHLTASGNISSSGQINADKIRAGNYAGSSIFDIAAGAGGIDTDGAMSCTGFSNSSTSTFGGRIDIVGASSYIQTPSYVSASQLISSGHITASGHISASGIIRAEGLLISDDATITDDLFVHGDIRIGQTNTIANASQTGTNIQFNSNQMLFDCNGIEIMRMNGSILKGF